MKDSKTKEHGKATVVLLFGTSSAGKGTIIKELKKQDGEKDEKDRLEWQEDGLDLEFRRHPKLGEVHLGIVAQDPDFIDLTTKQNLEPINILLPIHKNSLPEESEIYSADKLTKIQGLIEKYREPFQKAAKNSPSNSQLMENIFARAMENSRNGLPSVLDVVPLGEYDVVAEFNKYMADHNFSCPSVIAVAHCDINKIAEHIESRNATGVEVERRDGFFAFNQYGEMYKVAQEGERVIGQLKTQDILDAAQKYGDAKGGAILFENSKDAQGLIKALGIEEGHAPNDEKIKVTTKVPYDAVYQTDPESENPANPQAITEIAKRINSLATRKSELPSQAHPVAGMLASRPKFLQKIFDAKNNQGQNNKTDEREH